MEVSTKYKIRQEPDSFVLSPQIYSLASQFFSLYHDINNSIYCAHSLNINGFVLWKVEFPHKLFILPLRQIKFPSNFVIRQIKFSQSRQIYLLPNLPPTKFSSAKFSSFLRNLGKR